MERAGAISAQRLAARVGQRMRVLVDSIEGDIAIARGEGDAPDIDGVVRIKNGGKLVVGDFADVKIVSADAYDLLANPVLL